MTYTEIKNKVAELVKVKDVEGIMDLITFDNSREIIYFKKRIEARKDFYDLLRKSNETMKGLTDEDFDNIFNNASNNEEIRKALEEKGVKIIEPKKSGQWNQLFK